MNFNLGTSRHKGFTFIELLIVLGIMGAGTVFVVKNFHEKKIIKNSQFQAKEIHRFFETIRTFDPAEIYRSKAGDHELSPTEKKFVEDALKSGFNDLSNKFIDYQLVSSFGDDKLSSWKSEFSARTDVHEFSLISGLPKHKQGCLAFMSSLAKPPVHSIGYSNGLYKVSSNKPSDFTKICKGSDSRKFKEISINYCNYLDGKDCSNKP